MNMKKANRTFKNKYHEKFDIPTYNDYVFLLFYCVEPKKDYCFK